MALMIPSLSAGAFSLLTRSSERPSPFGSLNITPQRGGLGGLLGGLSQAPAPVVKTQLLSAAAELERSLGSIAQSARRFVPNVSSGIIPGKAAQVSGGLAIQSGSGGAPSVLETTQEVNTNTSTTRTSTSAMSALDLQGAQSTLASTGELNTNTSSYAKYFHTFANGTSTATLSGTFTGSATSVSLDVGRNATLSESSATTFRVRLKDQLGNTLYDSGNFSYTAGQDITLGSTGLTVKFSAGTTKASDSSTTTISSTTPTTVDTSATFDNADLNLRPRFDGNAQVTAGSFTLNGATINVAANDSIDSVISKINASSAGVTASFANDKLTLVSNADSESAITVGSDTSGFLAATKLSGATTTTGNIADDVQAFAQTAQFASVTNGSFQLNGVNINVSSTDTLQGLINTINTSGAGVTASFDSAQKKLTFTPNTPGATLSIENDTSGFLAAANVAQGTVGTAVNPNAAFDGTGLGSPLFDSGQSVSAGSFKVNGVSITVNASDTLNDVLTRITDSAANVTATFDAATETVRLETKTNTATPITVSDDTSGFLAAVKLDGSAQSTAGSAGANAQDPDTLIGNAPDLASVGAGTLTVNGTAIAIDPSTQSVRDIIGQIDALAGVQATINDTTGAIQIRGETKGATISLSDTSGLLGALGIASGTFKGTPDRIENVASGTGRPGLADPAGAAQQIAGVVGRLNQVLQGAFRGGEDTRLLEINLRDALRPALGEAAAGAFTIETNAGPGAKPPELKIDEQRLQSLLQGSPGQVRQVLRGLEGLAETTKDAVRLTDQQEAAATLLQLRQGTENPDQSRVPRAVADALQFAAERQMFDLLSQLPSLKASDSGGTSAFALSGASRAYGSTSDSAFGFGESDSDDSGSLFGTQSIFGT